MIDWGSCQYDSAADYYGELLRREAKTGRIAVLKELGISTPAQRGVNSAWVDFRRDQLETQLTHSRESVERAEARAWLIGAGSHSPENVAKSEKEVAKVRRSYDEVLLSEQELERNFDDLPRTVTAMLHFCRDNSWDLWGAAQYVAHLIFPGLDLSKVLDAPGFGPRLNVAVQSDNYRVAVCCWLLKSYGLVHSDEPFRGFDT